MGSRVRFSRPDGDGDVEGHGFRVRFRDVDMAELRMTTADGDELRLQPDAGDESRWKVLAGAALAFLAAITLVAQSAVPTAGAAQRARVEGKYTVIEKIVSSTEPYSKSKPAGKVFRHPATVIAKCPKGPCSKFTAKLKWLVANPWSGETSLETLILSFKETAPAVYEDKLSSGFLGVVGINCPQDEIGFRDVDDGKLVFRVVKSEKGIATKLMGTGEWEVDRGPCGVGRARENFTVMAQ
jgi:hypothetical protein